jgi:signal transduction histidine kinase
MDQKQFQVLLVEDNLADATLIRQAFLKVSSEKWHFVNVETLGDAITTYYHTLNDAESSPFDLVLLDLGLPDAKGLETIQQFLADAPEAPVVVLSGLDDEALALQAIEEGAQDYLVKDQITLQKLLKSIQFAMRRQNTLTKLRQLADSNEQALNQAEEINQQQLSFIGMVSHELRNPLGVIQSSTELIEMNLEETINAKIQKWLNKIHIANEQVVYLLNDVLTLCRLRTNNLNYQLHCVQLHSFCTDLIEQIQTASEQQHPIELTIQKGLSHIFTDSHLVKFIFTNLITNAVKYSPQGGIIRFSITTQEGWITFLVQDSGIGIPETEQDQLFEHFYRASNAYHIPGTGLGLTIAKRCVVALQGKIEVESQVNVGTTFKVQLPLILSPGSLPSTALIS